MKWRFADFDLDADARQLARAGDPVHLSRKAFDLLRILLARRPNVVAKEELYKELWPDTFVTDANLMVLVGEIRKAVGDNAHAPQFIRTAHGVGYAFCGDARELTGDVRVPRPRAWLIGEQRTFLLSVGDTVIGRDPQCDIWLDDAGVSRRHACVRVSRDGAAVTVRDLQSTNGTFVGGSGVSGEVQLKSGDVIEIGPLTLEFRSQRDEPPPTKRIKRGR